MRSWTRWVGVGAAVGIIAGLLPMMDGKVDLRAPLKKLELVRRHERAPEKPSLDGLNLLDLEIRPRRVATRLPGGRLAELTLDPLLQRTAMAVMKRYRIPEAGVVLMHVKTGKLLVYASYVNDGKPFDVNARAEAPAASVFKVVTGSALVELAGLGAKTEQCYHGGEHQIAAEELVDDPQRDKRCTTLGMAMGRSINVVFGRLAQKHLTPEDLATMGGAFGFGAPVPFPVANEAPKIDVPDDPVEFARTAAGFWHTSLSPLAGAELAQTIANDGVTLEPRILSAIYQGQDKLWEDSDTPRTVRRAIKSETAREVRKMMLETVANGSGYKSFHDERGNAFVPDVAIAGKTGTLTRHAQNRHYTWFVGFAPAAEPEVAVAALVVNTPIWQIKGPQLARDVLRAYFAKQGRKGVTRP